MDVKRKRTEIWVKYLSRNEIFDKKICLTLMRNVTKKFLKKKEIKNLTGMEFSIYLKNLKVT